MNKVRTRFAPSPTGFMHVGNLRSVIFEYLIAKKEGGDFLLRIEDTDTTRYVDGAVDFIYKTLDICNIKIDEGPNNPGNVGPYIQSQRLDLYKKYAHELVKMKKAYYCFCTVERLEELRTKATEEKKAFLYDKKCRNLTDVQVEELISKGIPYVIRQSMPTEGSSVYDDVVYGKIEIENKYLEDQILLKSDGYPTYNFANVVDDHLMGITHVVRGNEYLSSTPKYNLLYEAFGWEKPTYIHVPHVVKEGGKKLSKRENDASFMDLYKDGYIPQAIVNYLALLGWSPADNKEIFTMEELIRDFDVKRIGNSPAVYDIKKLQWINAKYIKALSDEEYFDLCKPYLVESYDLSDKSKEWINNLLLLYKEHISYGKQIVEEVSLFFNDDIKYDNESLEILNNETVANTLNIFKEEIVNINDWNTITINEAINNTKEKANVKGKLLFMPIRIKTSGIMHGPDLTSTIYLIGKETVLKRL